jgi:peptide/nickel transport system substrate-binding protein
MKCPPQYPNLVATTLVVQDALKRLGVDAQVVQEEFGTFVADTTLCIKSGGKEGGQIFCSGNSFRPDPDGYVFPYFDSQGTLNYGGYKNPKLDALIQEARQNFNHDERRSLYVEIQQTLLDESPNWWWYVAYNFEAMSTKLQGFTQSFTQRRFGFKRSWLSP